MGEVGEPEENTTASGAPSIIDLASRHEREWRLLWQDYAHFYGAGVPQAVTDQCWHALTQRSNGVFGLAAEWNGELAGFANIVVHFGTWSIGPVAYLEDLYVRGDRRRLGVGRALIDEVLRRARAESWGAVYWHVTTANREARSLYDRFAQADGFVRYRVFL